MTAVEAPPVGEIRILPRRLALFNVAPELFAEMAKGGRVTVEAIDNQLPADAQVIRMEINHVRNIVQLVVESAEFAPVDPGFYIPELPATVFRALRDVAEGEDGSDAAD